MKYFINAEFQTFAFEDSDTAEFIAGYAQPDWMQIANLPIETPAPAFDPLKQSVIRDGCEQVDGEWRYKWRIDALSAEQIEVNQAAAEAARIASLWQAANEYEYAQVSGSAIGLLAIGVLQSLPKCMAVQGWIKGIWSAYYERKATGSYDADYSVAGTCPHTVPELMAELGL